MGFNRKLIIILLLMSSKSFAQNAQEIFSQKKTALQYLSQQITALNLYIGYAQKGYSIAKDGLNVIGDLKKGDLNLHSTYLNSLKKINPTVEKYAKVADIISCNVNMVKRYKSSLNKMKQCGQFTRNEISYIGSVFTKVMGDASQIIDELISLITPGGFEMKDDERMRRIDALYVNMQDNQKFVQHFSNENFVLSQLRNNEKREIKISRSLNNLK